MATIRLSLPDEVAQEMDEFKEHSSSRINWSAIALDAFRDYMNSNRTYGENMEEVRERLLSSKARYEKELLDSGLEHGREWAKSFAEYEELERLSKAEDTPECFPDLFGLVSPGGDGDDYGEFIRLTVGENLQEFDKEAFCKGFANGATEIFREAMAPR